MYVFAKAWRNMFLSQALSVLRASVVVVMLW